MSVDVTTHTSQQCLYDRGSIFIICYFAFFKIITASKRRGGGLWCYFLLWTAPSPHPRTASPKQHHHPSRIKIIDMIDSNVKSLDINGHLLRKIISFPSFYFLSAWEHHHQFLWYPFFPCRCRHNSVQNPFHDDIKIMKIMPLPSECECIPAICLKSFPSKIVHEPSL